MAGDTLTHKRLLILVGFTLAMLTSAPLFGRDKDIVVMGTATPGGGFPAYGAVFAEIVNQTDPSVDIQPRNAS